MIPQRGIFEILNGKKVWESLEIFVWRFLLCKRGSSDNEKKP